MHFIQFINCNYKEKKLRRGPGTQNRHNLLKLQKLNRKMKYGFMRKYFLVSLFFTIPVQSFLSEIPLATSLKPECREIASKIDNFGVHQSPNICSLMVENSGLYPKYQTFYLCKTHWFPFEVDSNLEILDINEKDKKKTGCGFYRVSKERLVQCACAPNLYVKNEANTGYSYDYMEHLVAYLVKAQKRKSHYVTETPSFGEGILPKWAKRREVNHLILRIINYIRETTKSRDIGGTDFPSQISPLCHSCNS